jgi:hypothetical protein
MNAAYEELVHLLDERDVAYERFEEHQAIRTDLRGDIGSYRITAQVHADCDLFQVYGYSPLLVPEGCRAAIAEAIARANYGLRVGKFEMDFDDGEVRFHVAQIMDDEAIGEEVMDRMICTTLGMLDTYLPAFLSIIYGNETPEVAIKCAETIGSSPENGAGDGD